MSAHDRPANAVPACDGGDDGATWATRQVRALMDSAAAMVTSDAGLNVCEREADLIGLVIHAARTLLERPKASLDEVMDASYDRGAQRVRSWWQGWT